MGNKNAGIVLLIAKVSAVMFLVSYSSMGLVSRMHGSMVYKSIILFVLYLLVLSACVVLSVSGNIVMRIALFFWMFVTVFYDSVCFEINNSSKPIHLDLIVEYFVSFFDPHLGVDFLGAFPSSIYYESFMVALPSVFVLFKSNAELTFVRQIRSVTSRVWLSELIVFVVPMLLVCSVIYVKGDRSIRNLPSQYRVPAWVIHSVASYVYVQPDRMNVSIELNGTGKDSNRIKNIIMIVDESVRGDFLDINYNRGTTPVLLKNKERVINYGLATSGGISSTFSNQILRFGPDRERYKIDLYANPYIWAYMKRAEYQTYYIDAQYDHMRNNAMTKDESKYIDVFYHPPVKSRFEKDIQGLEYVQELLNDGLGSKFIYFIKKGIHFPYVSPKDNALYDEVSIEKTRNKREVRAMEYMNAVHGVIDPFFEALFALDIDESTIVIYTSDHGQSIFENGNAAPHGTSNFSIEEGLVPLFFLTKNKHWNDTLSASMRENKNNVSHFNIYPTVLLMAGYNHQQVNEKHGPSVLDEMPAYQHFATGCCSVPMKIGNNNLQPRWIKTAFSRYKYKEYISR